MVCSSLFCISRGKKTEYILLVREKFSFLYVDIWFDVAECKFIMKNSSFKILVVLSTIFVTDTKITFVYNFVAPLTCIGNTLNSNALSVIVSEAEQIEKCICLNLFETDYCFNYNSKQRSYLSPLLVSPWLLESTL